MMTSDDIFHSAHPHLLLLSATLLCHSQCLCRCSLASQFANFTAVAEEPSWESNKTTNQIVWNMIYTHIRSAGISPGCLVSPEENHMDPFLQVASASCSCVLAASAAREESWASWQGSGTRDSNKYEHMMFKHIIMLNSYDIMWYDIVWCTSLYIYTSSGNHMGQYSPCSNEM